MTDTTAEAASNAILIDGKFYKLLQGSIQFQDIATFAPKSTIGDYSRDSNPLLSSWVITDLSGGHGVASLEEGSDAGRYRFGVVDARRPRQITCPPETLTYVGADLGLAAGDAYVLGTVTDTTFVLFGTDIAAWDEATQTFADTGDNVTGVPQNKPTPFSRGGSTPYLYIPLGGDGYATYDGTTVTAIAAPDAVDFLVWDNKLLCVDVAGKLFQSADGVAWTDLGTDAKLDASATPRQLVVYFDRNDTPVPYLVTDGEIYAYDMDGPVMYRTELQWPQHRDMGLGAASWRGDLHVAVGMGVFRYNGSIITAIGLDRDQGLPTAYRGRIVDLLNEYNGMWALVSGASNESDGEEMWLFDETDDEWYVNPSTTVSSLHVFTALGWHCYWTTSEPMGDPTWSMTSCVDDTYRLWWGVGNSVNTMLLPIDFANARAAIESGQYRFAEYAFLETGRFDAAMQGYTKLGNADQLRAFIPDDGCRIDLSIRINGESNGYVSLGSITATGETTFALGDLIAGMMDDYDGEPFDDIELKFEFYGSGSAAPILESNVLSYLKINKSAISFNGAIDLSAPFKGRSSEQMEQDLLNLLRSSRFFTLVTNETPYRGRISSLSGGRYVGFGESRSQVQFSFIETPTSFASDLDL